MNNQWIALGSVFGFLSVAMGAFGAHALSESLSEKALSIYHTAAQYQMVHSLALVAVGILVAAVPSAAQSGWTQWAGWAFTFGIVIFSGSLYALAFTDIKILGAITPVGGLLFLAGWVCLALYGLKAS